MPTDPIVMPDAGTDPTAYKHALLDLATRAGTDLLEALAATIPAWRALTQDLTPDQLATEPEPGEWSIAQITAHLFDVELVFGFRGRMMLTADNPTYPGYDEKLWTPLPRPPFAELLDAWQALRRANLLVWQSIPKAAWTRRATHSEQGPETFDELIAKQAGHDIAHVNQLRRAIESSP